MSGHECGLEEQNACKHHTPHKYSENKRYKFMELWTLQAVSNINPASCRVLPSGTSPLQGCCKPMMFSSS